MTHNARETRKHLIAFAISMCVAAPAALALEPVANAGKLTCTVEPLPEQSKEVARDVSCRFQPLAGSPSSYTGRIKRIDGPTLSNQNLVFAWTVYAPETDVPPQSLNGTYLSGLSDQPAPSAMKLGSLRRNSKSPIELRALRVAGPDKNTPAVVLELELRSTRA